MQRTLPGVVTAIAVALGALTGFAEDAAKEAYLGVVTGPVGDALVSHLGLTDGLGLLVTHVAPNSPAAGALEKNDILVKLGDQKLVNHEQLAALIRAAGPGAEVTLEMMRGGKTMQKSVTLGEREARKARRDRWNQGEQEPGKGQHGEWPEFQIPDAMLEWFVSTNALGSLKGWDGEGIAELMKGLQSKGEQWQRDIPEATHKEILESISNVLKDVRSSLAAGGLKSLLGPDAAGSVSTSVSTTMVDDGTVITITGDNKERRLTIQNKDGKVVFDGPITTDAQRAAVPEEYKARIDRLEDMVNGESDVDLPED